MALTIHKVNDPKQNPLVDQHWEVSDPNFSCYNLQDLPIHFFSNPKEIMIHFHVWESGLPLCIVPQVFHFLELVICCADHFSLDSKSVFLEQLLQIVIRVSKESIAKMLGIHNSRFLEQNVRTLSEEVLV